MIQQIPDHHLQPQDDFECPQCGEFAFACGYCTSCGYDEEFEAKCDEYDNREKP